MLPRTHFAAWLAAGLAGAGILIAAAVPASAADRPGVRTQADQVASQIARVAPQAGEPRIGVTGAPGGLTARNGDVSITIPADSANDVKLARTGNNSKTQFGVGLLDAGTASKAVVARDGTVTYPDVRPATDLAVQPFAHSVRIQTVLAGEHAPSRFSYPIDVPSGGRLARGKNHTILIEDANGVPRGTFAAPWAKDRNGKSVPTSYQIQGTTIVQTVAHQGAAYPVVADPWLGFDLIDHATWVWLTGNPGWTFEVTPTTWARVNGGGYLVGVAGWDELYDKYKNRGLDTNLGSMRNQFICHQQLAFYKSTYNLDEWRPDVGYAATVAAECNP